MGLDNRGVERGGCSVSGCQCGDFVSFPTRQVCRTCLHPPVKHASKAPPAVLPPYPSGVQGRSLGVTHPGLMSYTNRFRNEGGGEGVQSQAKKVSSNASDTGSSVDNQKLRVRA